MSRVLFVAPESFLSSQVLKRISINYYIFHLIFVVQGVEEIVDESF